MYPASASDQGVGFRNRKRTSVIFIGSLSSIGEESFGVGGCFSVLLVYIYRNGYC